MIKNILDYQGQIIGELDLPDDTSDVEWSNALSAYAQPPKGMPELIYDKLQQYERAAPVLLRELKRDNTLAGITKEQSDQMFDDFADVLLRLREGAFPTAIYRLQQKEPIGFVTQPMIDAWILKIKAFL